MALKYTVLIVCSLALVGNTAARCLRCKRDVSETRNENLVRLDNFPAGYRTHEINFPGTVRSTESGQILEQPTIVRTTTHKRPLTRERIPTVDRLETPLKIVENRVSNDGLIVEHISSQSLPRFTESDEERLLREEQARNAHYTFGTNVQDNIHDQQIARQETRDGLALRGMYSYSDGFFKRTVHYEADENGYRVTKEEIEPIGDGPHFNPKGTAEIDTNLHGSHLRYSITGDDFLHNEDKKKVHVLQKH